ncbi:MAG TPA: cytochrome d ubiquinol oxidase subunit II, partial [Candidatus Limnocylindria bacterium]
VLMFGLQGANWLTVRTEGDLRQRAVRIARLAWPTLGAAWLAVTIVSRWAAPNLWTSFGSPLAWVAPLVGLLALLATGWFVVRGAGTRALLASSATIAALVAILGIGLYPAILPDGDGGPGLTVANAASSDLTLTVMLVIALIGMPVVLGYTAWIYRHFWRPVDAGEGGY